MKLNSAQISNFLFALFGLITSLGSVRVGLGTLIHPGPGFFPFWAGIFLAIISSFQFIKTISNRKGSEKISIWNNIEWKNLIIFGFSLFIYIFIVDLLGFFISSFFLLVVLFKLPKGQKWYVAIFSSLLTVFFSYLIFGYWLDVYFPQGIFPIFK